MARKWPSGPTFWGTIVGDFDRQADLQTSLGSKQDTLVSGTTIKTINGASVLGSGNLVIGGAATWGSISGMLSAQTDLQAALDAKADDLGSDDNYVTDAEKVKLSNMSGTNSGDNAVNSLYSGLAASKQDTLVSATNIKTINGASVLGSGDLTVSGSAAWGSITGTLSTQTDLQTALNGKQAAGSYAAAVHTHAQADVTNLVSDLAAKQPLDSDLTTIAGLTATTDSFMQAKGSAWAARTVAQVKTDLGLTGTNSGDQTSIVGITGTKAQFDTAVSDGNILYVGDVTQYTDEAAQDAIGTMVDASLTYVDATPILQRAALTGAITAPAGSNATSLGSFTTAQLNAALSDADVATGGGTASGTNTGDNATNTQYSGLAASKQDTLVSATNIKTINGSSVLGSGNLVVTGPGGATVGQGEVDFGAFPGASDTSLVIIGQTTIAVGSRVIAQIFAKATTDHSEDEHFVEPIEVMAGALVAGTGFTIFARNASFVTPNDTPRLYGKFTVNWSWV
jgi:hypothetical protein